MWALTPFSEQMLITAPSALGFQDRQYGLHGPQRPEKADRHAPRHLFIGFLLEAADASAVTPGVVHEYVDRTPRVAGELDHRQVVGLAAGVGAQEADVGAELRIAVLGDLGAGLLIDFGDHHPGAFPGEAADDPLTDPVTAPRHDRDLALKPAHRSPFPPVLVLVLSVGQSDR
jgi:hypothetical protein